MKRICYSIHTTEIEGECFMKYALLGDLHSSVKDTKAVLKQIAKEKVDEIYGLGDLYECKIGKKKAQKLTNVPLEEAAVIKEKFEKLLTFPSIRGNQEERISKVTGIEKFASLPETIRIHNAILIHGHQFEYSENWTPSFFQFDCPYIFFGHSHESAIYESEQIVRKDFNFGEEILLPNKQLFINVGSVVGNREWCLYNSDKHSIKFMKA